MRFSSIPETIEAQESLDGLAGKVADVIAKVVPTGPAKDALSGTWLGHALHPMLTDLPIGFWTSSMVLDLVGGKKGRPAADLLVTLGILSALPTAATGLSDFADTVGAERRVGVVHAAANTVAVTCYLLSRRARRKGKRVRGVALGFLGGGAATVGGYLGGHLLETMGIGVDTTAFDRGPSDWTVAGSTDELVEGAPVRMDVAGVGVMVVERGGGLDAIADRCTHRGGPLSEGDLVGDCIRCPWHGSMFRVDDGSVQHGPATQPQPAYEARITDDKVEVRRARTRPA
ncbi:MAG TPA: Rieske 2Fe-2S domain-containing protein [Acidimicrobiales bacterium]|nr:Rieske 2Fe-2S domain-containing protein [Acidimicrobiales bacterium]